MKAVPVSDFAAQVDYGVTASASKDPIGPKMLRITDIRDTGVNWSTVPHCAGTTKGVQARRLEAGDIVFARTGSTGNSLMIRDCPDGAVFASYLIRLRVQPGVADPGYVSHFFQSPGYWRQIASVSDGGVQKGVNASKLKKLLVPLPAIKEQRRIAAVLDAAEALRAKRRQALAKLGSLTQAIFFEMFGDRRNPERGQADVQLGDCVELFSGSTLPEGEEFGGQVGGYALVKVSDLARDGNEKFITSTREWSSEAGPAASTCPSDSIVFAKRGGAIAKNRKRITTIPSVLDPNLMGVTPKSELLTLAYLYAWFEQLDLQSIQSGSSVPQLNKKDLAPLKLKLPRVEDQNKYARLVDNVDSIKSQMLQQSLQLDTLFASLQQKAFRGEL